MEIRIERATIGDAEALVRLQVDAFHSDSQLYPNIPLSGPPDYESVDVMRDKITRHLTYKVLVDGRIAGGLVAFDKGKGHIHLDVLFVAPTYHSLGIGTQTVRFIEAAHPATKWTLETPDWALRNQHFYEKLGYNKVGATVYPDITLIEYEKRLD